MTNPSSIDLVDILRQALDSGASDVIISAGAPPAVRIDGQIAPAGLRILTPKITRELLYGILKDHQIARFEKEKELDFSFSLDGHARFRGNLFYQRGSVAGAFRLISERIPELRTLNLPAVLEEFALSPQGLVLVTGPTGHGKSTTQAAMIHLINTRRRTHIITIEDPIEFVHANHLSIVEQREVGEDTHSFSEGLKHILREAPDVILIGEMRDPESIACALTAAETGHLVIATVHTNDAVQAVDRLIDVFPGAQQAQIRGQLSMCLLGVVAQRLLPRADGKGRVPAVEVLRHTSAVAHLIRDGRIHQLYAIMETHARDGMKTMDAALKELYLRGDVGYDEARGRMRNPQMLDRD
ncbi:MAG: type IV pilus twitching motility protein PilT [Planctomycetes bacterium]|nr:type IV pilus twitching motility protein PilT [Planctomycetota bacterium]